MRKLLKIIMISMILKHIAPERAMPALDITAFTSR